MVSVPTLNIISMILLKYFTSMPKIVWGLRLHTTCILKILPTTTSQVLYIRQKTQDQRQNFIAHSPLSISISSSWPQCHGGNIIWTQMNCIHSRLAYRRGTLNLPCWAINITALFFCRKIIFFWFINYYVFIL